MIQFRHSILPLFVFPAEGVPKNARDIRYAGVSYHFNDKGDIATCAHIVNGLAEGERLVGVEMHGSCLTFPVDDIRCHPKYDFAVGRVRRQNYKAMPISDQSEIFIGTDVMAFGFTTAGLVDEKLGTVPRLFKGHVVRTYHEPELPVARSTCEISFPSHNGFSGAPLLLNSHKTCIAGMLYGNYESTIALHKFMQIEEGGNRFSEEIHKVVELGAAHTAQDILTFLGDLGVTRIALADSGKING